MRRICAIALALTIAAGAPAGAGTPGDEVLVVFTLRTDGEVIEVYDPVRGLLHRESHLHAEEPAAASSSSRCANGGTHNPIGWGNPPVREARPWRTPEVASFSTAGVPASVASWWKARYRAAADQWEHAINACGLPDTSAWRLPIGADVATPLSGTCSLNADAANLLGWADLGGWGGGGLVLGRACLRSSPAAVAMFEGDIVLNNNPAAVWCDGACPGGYDVQSVAAHEFGHYLGLGHVCNDADLANPCDSAAESAAVMYPWIEQNSAQNRTLSAGDIAGVAALYPASYAFSVAGITLAPGPDGVLVPGERYPVVVDLRNTGFEPWPVSAASVLATDPAGRCSAFAAPAWLDCTRAAAVQGDVTDDQDTRWPNGPSTVIRGEVARFSFDLAVPPDGTGGAAAEAFRAVIGGVRASGGPASIGFEVGRWDAGPAAVRIDDGDDAGTLALAPGRTYRVTAEMTNTGTISWPVGGMDVRTHPDGRASAFRASSWPDGTTAGSLEGNAGAPGSSVVRPGEAGRFTLEIAVPASHGGGPVAESFSVAVPGSTRRLSPFVVSASVGSYAAEVVGQAGPDATLVPGVTLERTLVPGVPSVAWLDVRNTGTAPWFVGDGAVSLDHPSGCSPYAGSDWNGCTSAGPVDENRTAPGAAVIRPGEVGRVRFTMTTRSPVPSTGSVDLQLRGGGAALAGATYAFTTL